MNKLPQNRTLICTFIALASGFFGAYAGGQISWAAHSQQCENGVRHTLPIPGYKPVCKALVMPGSFMQGSTTGLWTGAILGAFIAGLATHKKVEERE